MNVKVFTFKGRCCRIRDVVQLLVASRAEAVEAGIDKPDPRCRPHSLTKSLRNCIIANPQTFDLDDMDEHEFEIIKGDPPRGLCSLNQSP